MAHKKVTFEVGSGSGTLTLILNGQSAIDLVELALDTIRPKRKRGHMHEDKFYFSLSGSFVYLRSNAVLSRTEQPA